MRTHSIIEFSKLEKLYQSFTRLKKNVSHMSSIWDGACVCVCVCVCMSPSQTHSLQHIFDYIYLWSLYFSFVSLKSLIKRYSTNPTPKKKKEKTSFAVYRSYKWIKTKTRQKRLIFMWMNVWPRQLYIHICMHLFWQAWLR